jgi:hypothetical protein
VVVVVLLVQQEIRELQEILAQIIILLVEVEFPVTGALQVMLVIQELQVVMVEAVVAVPEVKEDMDLQDFL